jgi:hypothetical protein
MSAIAMRRLTIAAGLCILGTLVYLYWSEGPARVHWVTIATQVPCLIGLSALAWVAEGLHWKKRLAIGAGLIAIIAAAGSYLDGIVIAALIPFHPIYFILAFFSFLVEGILLLLLTWLIDRALNLEG